MSFGMLLWAASLAASPGDGPGRFTDVQAIQDRFEFSIQTSAPAGEWRLEAADSAGGPWAPLTELGPNLPYRVSFPLDRPERYFRLVWGEQISTSVAGYIRLNLGAGFSMIANPFRQGGNSLAELFPDVPLGTRVYRYDPVRQEYASISQWQFLEDWDRQGWDHPRTTLAPGEGAYLELPQPLEIRFAGTLGSGAAVIGLEGGWNMTGWPPAGQSGLPAALEGDQILRQEDDGFAAHRYELGAWTPPLPEFRMGESFWYHRNSPNPTAEERVGTVYWNTYVPGGHVDARVFSYGLCPAWPNWRLELWAGTSFGNIVPVSEPAPAMQGWLDTREQTGVVRIPFLEPGSTGVFVMRAWDARFGATWTNAIVRGESPPVVVSTGGAGPPPAVPAPLTRLQGFNLAVSCFFCGPPADQIVTAGAAASFSVGEADPPPSCVSEYQWQRSRDSEEWEDVPGATSSSPLLEPVSAADAGWYRVIKHDRGWLEISDSARLTVIAPPSLELLALDHASLRVRIEAVPGLTQVIETSTDLRRWFEWERFSDVTEPMELLLPRGEETSRRFYRVKISR